MTEIRSPLPRDDRAWPAGALPMSVAAGVLLVGGAIALVVASAGRGAMLFAVTLGGSLVMAAGGALFMTRGQRDRLDGGRARGTFLVIELVAAGAMILVFRADTQLGGALFCASLGVAMLANARMIRIARANRPVLPEAAPAAWPATQVDPADGGVRLARAPVPAPRPSVGQLLHDAVAVRQRRWIAWLVAAAIALPVAAAAGAPDEAIGMIIVLPVIAVPVALLRLWPAWRSRRRFERATTSPRRAYVAVPVDAIPQLHPMVAIWSRPPSVADGRVARPERAYRIDPRHDALVCGQADVIVHEAWVDTSARRPRWIVADAGLVVPRRWSPLGPFYLLSQVTWLAVPRPLTTIAPHPSTEPPAATRFDRRRFAVAVAQRLAVVAALAVLMSLD